MNRTLSIVVAFLSVIAGSCGSGGGGSDGTSCTLSISGQVDMCYAFKPNFPAQQSSTICGENGASVGAIVPSCPTANVVGTCTLTFTSPPPTTGYDWVFYSSGGQTCAKAKQACAGADGVIPGATSTFVGNGC